MDNQRCTQIATALAQRAGSGANTAQITEVIVSIWQEIDAALKPVIGQRGVAALYKRSLYLTSAIHPWLANAHESIQTSIDLTALQLAFTQQSRANAEAGANALLQTFCALLTTLIGPSLTEQLLHPIWTKSMGDSPGQDTLP